MAEDESTTSETIVEVIEAILDPTPDTDTPLVATEGFVVAEPDSSAEDVPDDSAPVAAEASGEPPVPDEEEPAESSGPTPEEQEAAAHADTAREAQDRADADIASGDYAAAAQEKETAENEAWEAGDSDMLHGSTSTELDTATANHADADRLEQEEAQHVRDGDYGAAREDAGRAADAQSWSDYRAGGEDHTGQARAEYEKEDWAVWHEEQAGDAERNAEWYAAHGNADAAENYADLAADHQARADEDGQAGEHGAAGAVYDASSEMAHDTPVGGDSSDDHSTGADDGASADHSTDSGADCSADTSSSYDSGSTDSSDS